MTFFWDVEKARHATKVPLFPSYSTHTHSQMLEVVLWKVCCVVLLVLRVAVTALGARQATDRVQNAGQPHVRPHLPERWLPQLQIGTRGCTRTQVENGHSGPCPRASAWPFHAPAALSLASGGAACGLLQPSALYWVLSDCHILGEWMFSTWLQQLSQSSHLMQGETRWHKDKDSMEQAASRCDHWTQQEPEPLLHKGTRGQPELPHGWGASPSACCCGFSPLWGTPAQHVEGMPSHRFCILT